MAGLGMTKLEAINELLESINELPVAAVDSSGSWPTLAYGASEAGRAELALDRESRRYQSAGWPDNTDVCRFFPLNASSNTKLDLSTISGEFFLFVRGAGPQHYLDLSLRNGIVWNSQTNTDVLTPVSTTVSEVVGVYLDAVKYINFNLVGPRLKDAIIGHAKLIYQRRTRQSPLQDAFNTQESTRANVISEPVMPKKDGRPLSPWPLNPTSQPPQQQQGQ